MQSKLKKIAILLAICNEPEDVVASEMFTLPKVNPDKITKINPDNSSDK